jgi:hypothetical protein
MFKGFSIFSFSAPLKEANQINVSKLDTDYPRMLQTKFELVL